MSASPPRSLATMDVKTDLKAAVEARRELGADLEDHVLEEFLARVQQRIDAQLDERLAKIGGKMSAKQRKSRMSGWTLPASLAVSFPLVGIAGWYGGGFGILVVMTAVVVLTAIWLDYSKH